MVRVLALIKYGGDLKGLRLFDEKSGGVGDFSVDDAKKFINTYGCSNVKFLSNGDLEGIECSIDRFPCLGPEGGVLGNPSIIILGKERVGQVFLFVVVLHTGVVHRCTEQELINTVIGLERQYNCTKVLTNAKIVKSNGAMHISAIKGSFKVLSKHKAEPEIEPKLVLDTILGPFSGYSMNQMREHFSEGIPMRYLRYRQNKISQPLEYKSSMALALCDLVENNQRNKKPIDKSLKWLRLGQYKLTTERHAMIVERRDKLNLDQWKELYIRYILSPQLAESDCKLLTVLSKNVGVKYYLNLFDLEWCCKDYVGPCMIVRDWWHESETRAREYNGLILKATGELLFPIWAGAAGMPLLDGKVVPSIVQLCTRTNDLTKIYMISEELKDRQRIFGFFDIESRKITKIAYECNSLKTSFKFKNMFTGKTEDIRETLKNSTETLDDLLKYVPDWQK